MALLAAVAVLLVATLGIATSVVGVLAGNVAHVVVGGVTTAVSVLVLVLLVRE
jgi:hypothetical protein